MAARKLGSVKATDTMLITSANLATEVTGVLSVANGGTGQSSYTDGQILYGVTAGNTLAKGDHGNIAGLSDDDHTQYYNQARGDARYLTLSGGTMTGKITLDGDPSSSLHAASKNYVDNSDATNLALVPLLAGRAGGQTIKGGTASGESLTLVSTNHATKGNLIFGASNKMTFNETDGRLGIGNATPITLLHVAGVAVVDAAVKGQSIIDATEAYSTTPAAGLVFGVKYNAAGTVVRGASIQGRKENATDGDYSQNLVFTTIANGGSPAIKMILLFNGNVGLNGQTTFGTSAVGVACMANGTDPTSSPTNAIQFWASSGEMKVRDASGNATTLSPHHFIMAPSEEMAWSFYSERDAKYIYADMAKALRVLEQLSGQTLIHIGALK